MAYEAINGNKFVPYKKNCRKSLTYLITIQVWRRITYSSPSKALLLTT